MTSYDPIEQEITSALTKFHSVAMQKNYTDPDWTKGIEAIFGAIGYQKGYQTYFRDSAARNRSFDEIQKDVGQMLGGVHVPNILSEWLYDILWWYQNDRDYVIDIPLVAEVEWGDANAVKDDFQKLLLARSKFRVMIFHCGDDFIQLGKTQIKEFKYTKTGDRYLFCSHSGNQIGFHFELYIVP
jgi:hypothetical protein